MTNNNELLAKPVEFEVNGEAVKLTGKTVKNFLVSGNGEVSDQEVVMFINLCKYQKLNPFLNEAYLVKFKSKSGPDKPAQVIVSKEAFMKRAEKHPNYEGFEAGIIVERDGQLVDIEGAIKLTNDKLVGGWARVYRSDRQKPITTRISLSEFSKGQSTWNSMPLTMIRKSAIVNAQREAFPETLGALYTEDDAKLETTSSDDQEHVVEQEIKTKANQEVIDVEYTEEAEQKAPKQEQTKTIQDGPGF
jgi:phage recombination protein Bet